MRPTPGRRPFLKLLLASVGATALPRKAAAAPYRVGVGHSTDAYTATRTAVTASGEWPSSRIAGQTVVIKTNLVLAGTTESGGTTSPQVVRALVDLALDAGAASVLVAEGGRHGAPFSLCGYDIFQGYDPRVALTDLAVAAATTVAVTNGWTYRWIYMPTVVLGANTVFVSAGKLKTHVETGATLSMKNLFGLPPILPYFDPTQAEFRSRYHMHDRGVHQAIVDLNLVRPVDFAVVDGIWGMEGDSPDAGTPVEMDLVAAGRNALAVDRVCLDIMQVPQTRAQHLTYATLKGLGPSAMSQIDVVGDGYVSRAFQQPVIPPQIWPPKVTPLVFSPGSGQQSSFTSLLTEPGETRLEVLRSRDIMPSLTRVRLLRDWAARSPGVDTVAWDGRDDSGSLVAPGTYAVRFQSRRDADSMFSSATTWVGTT
jgi:uncharacterized protein (DUF362 family)